MLASFPWNPNTCFAQIACSVELIQTGWVSVDNSPGLTQLPSCHPAQGTKRSCCLSIALCVFSSDINKEVCYSPNLAGMP